MSRDQIAFTKSSGSSDKRERVAGRVYTIYVYARHPSGWWHENCQRSRNIIYCSGLAYRAPRPAILWPAIGLPNARDRCHVLEEARYCAYRYKFNSNFRKTCVLPNLRPVGKYMWRIIRIKISPSCKACELDETERSYELLLWRVPYCGFDLFLWTDFRCELLVQSILTKFFMDILWLRRSLSI